jgi:hypothetical protein
VKHVLKVVGRGLEVSWEEPFSPSGGHVLANYLQAVGKATPVVAAVLVAPCLDFVRTWHYAEQQQRHPVYRQVLTNNMRVCAARHRDNDVRVMTCALVVVFLEGSTWFALVSLFFGGLI